MGTREPPVIERNSAEARTRSTPPSSTPRRRVGCSSGSLLARSSERAVDDDRRVAGEVLAITGIPPYLIPSYPGPIAGIGGWPIDVDVEWGSVLALSWCHRKFLRMRYRETCKRDSPRQFVRMMLQHNMVTNTAYFTGNPAYSTSSYSPAGPRSTRRLAPGRTVVSRRWPGLTLTWMALAVSRRIVCCCVTWLPRDAMRWAPFGFPSMHRRRQTIYEL